MRYPIISDTTRSVFPVKSDLPEDGGSWVIKIVCPVDGVSISGAGIFPTRERAMRAIERGEY